MPTATDHELFAEVPLGARVLVRSGLGLGDPRAHPVSALLQMDLERFEGPGLVILAGGTFAPGIDAAWALGEDPELAAALTRFAAEPTRRVLLLEASPTTAARRSSDLASMGLEVGTRATLRCTTASGAEDVVVLAEEDPTPIKVADDAAWQRDLDLAVDESAARRAAASRALYRRLSGLLWIPPVLALVVAVLTDFSWVGTRLERMGHRRRFFQEVADATWAQRILVMLLAVVVVELIVFALATWLARRSFDRHAHSDESSTAESIEQTVLDRARTERSRGARGVIIGNATSLGLSPIDVGFVALCQRTGAVLEEHEGRFGLPPIFAAEQPNVSVILETGAELHVALMAGSHIDRDQMRRFERLALGDPRSELPGERAEAQVVADWPHGASWPPPVNLAEERRRRRQVRRLAGSLLFATGLLDLLVAVIPPLRWKLKAVLSILPLGVSQTAAAVMAIVGICLVMLARGIYRGQRRAWRIAVVLLGLSVVLHLVHALNLIPLLISAGVLALLLVKHRDFGAATDRGSLAKAAPALITVVVLAILAGFFGTELSQRHKGTLPAWPTVLFGVAERLIGFTTVTLPDRVDDFLYPSMLVVGISVLITVLYLLTRPAVDRRLSGATSPELRRLSERRARDLVTRYGRGTLDYFALRDDKQFFFSGDTLIAYAVFGGVALVAPDPIGPEAERTQAWAAFRAHCDAQAWTIGVIGAGLEWLPIYQASNMRYLYIGDEAVVDIQNFSLEGGKMKGLRQACTRLERKGYTVEFLDPAAIDASRVRALVELMGLNRRGEGERGFSMQLGRLFDPKDEGLLLCVVSDEHGEPAAMCQFVPSTAIGGWSLDLMRRDPGEHPNGLLDYALCSTIARLKEQGATGLSLNFSAFRSTLDGERGDSISQRAQRWGLRRLSTIMPIETLWKFNEKYHPNWLARHLVFANPETFVPVLSAAFRAESLTEIPVVGRFLTQDPSNRPGTIVPPEILEAAGASDLDVH